jgi:hypothetical protein
MHKSTRYGYLVLKSYFERFFTVRSTTRTTNFPDIDHGQKTTQPSLGYYSEGAAAAFLLRLSWAERNSGRCEHARARRARAR